MKKRDPFKLIKILLGLKAVILVSILLLETNIIRIGEANLHAQNNQDEERQSFSSESEYYEENKLPDIHELIDIKTAPEAEVKKSVSRYLDIIEKRKSEAIQQLNHLDTREEQIKKLEEMLDKKLKDLEEERRFIMQTIQKEKEIKEDRLKKLIALYEKMEPKKAAPVFEEIDKDLAAALFKRLKKKQVTAIIERMNPEKAVELTEYFGRVKSGAEYDLLKEMNRSLLEAFDDCKK